MTDCMTGRNIAENFHAHGASRAPNGCGSLDQWTLDAIQCCTASSVLSVINVWVLYNQEETLDLEARRSIDWVSCNPLAFITLFTKGATLRTLTLTSGIQTYTDSRLMENVATLMAKEKLGYSDQKVSGFLTLCVHQFPWRPARQVQHQIVGTNLAHTRFPRR